ncbi:hypothetical protein [Sphingomonas sp. GM_Shp_1]|uniref:hypothetical protein n=1 Tax=Sphingomonas sp. GM_Shp_1 TaxID=2937381 RepID=UPI00226B1F74|nr:hypothetical protein [Sphingomonas sp. GM_Shp_1]
MISRPSPVEAISIDSSAGRATAFAPGADLGAQIVADRRIGAVGGDQQPARRVPFLAQGQAHDMVVRRHTRVDCGGGQVDARSLGGDDVQFLLGCVAIGLAQLGFPGCLGLGGPLLAVDEANALVEPLREGILERQAIDIALALARPNVLDELVERIVLAVMGRDDDDTPAPHEHGERRLQQLV